MAIGRQVNHRVVIVSQSQADALEKLRSNHHDYEIVEKFAQETLEYQHPLYDFDLENLICALYIGYEVEKTPEEKLIEWYNNIDNGSKNIVEVALNKLELKIKGVNK